ncbi:DNA damage-regulated autophagy modulator protein 2 [Ischnura elegans]|uniref:DNA damage-regulated autophagy modulator protein 2 n=1 Tax=Ischnura elegans TaxID=197161 RepID=UPI001ED8B909|nr:DNA damage-regulated autophagy modulator protein 2 [Ischnura elegans]XP_046400854.1 DNA damage-regulated autophagy modulator protein 2 [Ischnura elegans]
MTFEKLHYIPIAVFILFPTTFLGTYIAAVLQGHVEPNFPYISDAATYSPESCVFGQLINMGSILLAACVYVRYREIEEFPRMEADNYQPASPVPLSIRLNHWSLCIGLISCLGLSIVANFQETNVIVVHLTGAFLCFGMGTLYFWTQAFASYHIHPFVDGLWLAHVRIILSVICTIFFVVLSITGVASHLLFHGSDPRKWYPEDGGWGLHVASTASEWVVACAFCLYILSFVPEFRRISIEEPRVTVAFEMMRPYVTDISGEAFIGASESAEEVYAQSNAQLPP